MTDHWFIQEIEHKLKSRKRVVIIDPKGQCGFLLSTLDSKNYQIIRTDASLTEHWQTVKEELYLRHEAETTFKDQPVVFYVTRDQDKLTFLFDYCFTHGCLDLSNPAEWLRKKLFANTGLQIQMDNNSLLTAAKLGIGKDIAWWQKILQNLEDMVNLEDELLPFLNEPGHYLTSKEADIRRLFEEKLFELLGQPYMAKPPETLASEICKRLFDGLAYNDLPSPLLQLYYRWVDSETYRECFEKYLGAYKIEPSLNPWAAHSDHCFIKIDQDILRQLAGNIWDKSFIADKITRIKARFAGSKAKRYIPSWWQDVITLLEFDVKPITNCNNFSQLVDFYINSFSKADRAIRNLYVAFLQEEAIIRPIQEYYDNLENELLQKWFSYTTYCKSDQQGYLVDLFKTATSGTAVIVGDGLRYEIADFVANSLGKHFKTEKQVMLADMPSETEHNMSALYVGDKALLPIHKDREKRLAELSGKPISFMPLDAVNYGTKSDYLVISYRDIDEAGEKLQLGAIKLFEEFEKQLIEKITLLLNIGFKEVHLVTDHGFVLTGLLDEADKIEPNAKGKKEVRERYIRTVELQENKDWLKFDVPYGEYKYIYVAQNHRPFKSTGTYGYSHGGFTPQEIIIPRFTFRKEKEVAAGLGVTISNKAELADVTGDLFVVKLQSASATSDLFAVSRKVQLIIYAGGQSLYKSSNISLDAGKSATQEFSFKEHSALQAVLVDAITQERLDSADIKKSTARDLGGLM